jgi:hypothetical protein
LAAVLCLFAGCSEYHTSDDPTLRLAFSTDTLSFDTVFTAQGSATAQMKVYNRNASALLIDRVWLKDGKAYRVNIDGEPDADKWRDIQINGHDSLYLFIRVKIDPLDQDNPVLVTDQLCFHLKNGHTQEVELEAYGQDVKRIGHKGCGRTDTTSMAFTAERPYLIFDTLIIRENMLLEAGTTVYMHNGACIYVGGDVTAAGTVKNPIVFRGDRLDRLFDSVPYAFASGSWNGIYLQGTPAQKYELQYVDILSGNIGLYSYNDGKGATLPHLTMNGCRIHNHSMYGLVLVNTDATVTNSEISNCASYCVYCAGGTQRFFHTTVASYFGFTNIRIQSVAKDDVAAVFIDNLDKTTHTTTSFYNSIITGYLSNQLVVATPFDQYYPGEFIGNYLKTDSLDIPNARDNTYWQKTDTTALFVNDFYKYKEYIYYNFHLDSISPAIGIADSLLAVPYPSDRDGFSRAGIKPDAGCYQHLP